MRRILIERLGLEVTPLTSTEVAEGIYKAISTKSRLRIANQNLHGAYMYHTNESFREYCDSADWTLVDGWPIWLFMKLQTPSAPGTETRIGSSDWLKELLELGEHMTICAVAGTEESAALATEAIANSYPHVNWTGFHGFGRGGPIASDLRDAISEADIVLVGMGMPRQEEWILRNSSLLGDKVVANVGGCIDYIAGTQKHAPRWLGKVGLEWVYRLAASPSRLASRYLLEPALLASVLFKKRRLTNIKVNP